MPVNLAIAVLLFGYGAAVLAAVGAFVWQRRRRPADDEWDTWVKDWTSGDLERFDRALRDRD